MSVDEEFLADLESFISNSGVVLSGEFMSDWSRKLQVLLLAATATTFLLLFGIIEPSEITATGMKGRVVDASLAPLFAAVGTAYLTILYLAGRMRERSSTGFSQSRRPSFAARVQR